MNVYRFLISGDADDQNNQATSHVEMRPVSSSIQEHQRVFNYMQPRSGGFNPRNKKSASTSSKKGKGKLQCCTLKFFCLSKVNSEKPPSSVYEKTGLSNIRHQHHCHWCPRQPRFPLLQAGGGYELLLYQRGGPEQGFHNIPPPYTPARIKELAGQAHVYVRPLQQELDDIEQAEVHCTTVKVSKWFSLSWYEIVVINLVTTGMYESPSHCLEK